MGFKLFAWQKYYIICGQFRRYGETTAIALRILLSIDEPPLDFTTRPRSMRERFERNELLKIKEQLDLAGIETRKIATTKILLDKYMEEYRTKITPRHPVTPFK